MRNVNNSSVKINDSHPGRLIDRRRFLGGSLAAASTMAFGLTELETTRANELRALKTDDSNDYAQIAITLDLEMSAQYPRPGMTEWNFEKGNLDADTKTYAVEAAKRVKSKGGVIHFFALGRTMEQENVEWIKEIMQDGHPIGNHTYDHVNVQANRLEDIQFRFKRSPWLIENKKPEEVITNNIQMAARAMSQRVGLEVRGFRTPGGFHNGLKEHPHIQKILLEQKYRWVSSLYPLHDAGKPAKRPGPEVFRSIIEAQAKAQPFIYPSGLIELPMNPISDVGAFRSSKWPLDSFLEAIRQGVQWAIDNKAVYDFLAHPSCLVITDPQMKSLELICDMVKGAGSAARIVDLDQIADRVARRAEKKS